MRMQRNFLPAFGLPALAASLPVWLLPAAGAAAAGGLGLWAYLRTRNTDTVDAEELQRQREEAQRVQSTTTGLSIQLWLEQNAAWFWGGAAAMGLLAGYLYWRTLRDSEDPAVHIVESE